MKLFDNSTAIGLGEGEGLINLCFFMSRYKKGLTLRVFIDFISHSNPGYTYTKKPDKQVGEC